MRPRRREGVQIAILRRRRHGGAVAGRVRMDKVWDFRKGPSVMMPFLVFLRLSFLLQLLLLRLLHSLLYLLLESLLLLLLFRFQLLPLLPLLPLATLLI